MIRSREPISGVDQVDTQRPCLLAVEGRGVDVGVVGDDKASGGTNVGIGLSLALLNDERGRGQVLRPGADRVIRERVDPVVEAKVRARDRVVFFAGAMSRSMMSA